MAKTLRRLAIKRVSAVDNPANEHARIVFFKGSDQPEDDCDLCKAEISSETRGELSDADFAAVWTDSEGRKQRKLPIHDAAHVRKALGRWNRRVLPPDVKHRASGR